MMKKFILTVVLAAAYTTLSAQTESTKGAEQGFNKWSIELAGGVNKTIKPLSAGFISPAISPLVVDLGVRYMLNNKFGFKADFGYNSFEEKNGTSKFDTEYYRADFQGVANLGRIMNFETWTNSFGILGHTGIGVARLKHNMGPKANDNVINFIAGLTAQIKLSNRIALTGDISTILNAQQQNSFDGFGLNDQRGFSGVIYNATAGLTVYLGRNSKHADWIITENNEIAMLKSRIDNLETMLIDSDQDGVADYLDREPNTISGVMVDSNGRAIDKNQNRVPDELESYLAKNYVNNADKSALLNSGDPVKSLINGGYVAAYFDFNKSTPTKVATENIDFILTYLRKNPSATIDIIGHADELGKTSYNNKLSLARANYVKNILVKAKVSASRLNVIAAGEDASVEKNSASARELVRKVTFMVK
jgi:outer membrane protein OmpA-like peptidoglycan-associated protein